MIRVLLIGACLGLTLGACASSEPREPDAQARYEAVVPGGAKVSVLPGSPEYCTALARSRPLREVGAAMDALALSPGSAPEELRLRRAADALREIGGRIKQRSEDFTTAATTLGQLADRGFTDRAAVTAVSTSLSILGKTVQGACGFPVG